MTEPELPILYTDVAQRPNALQLFESVDVLQAASITISPVGDPIQAGKATEMRAQAQKIAKDLDAERLESTKGLRTVVDRLNAAFNQRIDVLTGLVKSIDGALKTYMNEQARKQREEIARIEQARREENARLAAEAAEKGVDPPPPPPPAVIPPSANPFKLTGSHGASLSMRDNWKWRVVDISRVSESLLVPPADRIIKPAMNSLAKARAKDYVAGWRIEHPGEEPPTVIKDAVPGIELYNEPINASSVL